MEVLLEVREPARHEAAVLADRVAAHRALALRHEAAEGLEEDLLALGLVDRAFLHAGHESGAGVRVGVPGVHAVEDLVALMHGNHGALVQDVQILVGDDRRDLDHAIHLGLKPGHLHVDPDQVVVRIRGISFNVVRHG